MKLTEVVTDLLTSESVKWITEKKKEKRKKYKAETWFYPLVFDWMEEDLNVNL